MNQTAEVVCQMSNIEKKKTKASREKNEKINGKIYCTIFFDHLSFLCEQYNCILWSL